MVGEGDLSIRSTVGLDLPPPVETGVRFEESEEGRRAEGTMENAEERADFIIDERWRVWRFKDGEGG